MDEAQHPDGRPLPAADPRVLGQLLAAQNLLPVLPTAKRVAEFYADALAWIPGVDSIRVCLAHASSATPGSAPDGCHVCERQRCDGDEDDPTLPPELICPLSTLPAVSVIPLRTARARYGYFVIHVGNAEVYGRYAPFVANLGSFLALWLENRAQQESLQRARGVLECRVDERTAELRSTNARLEAEIEERKRAEAMVRRLNEELEQRVLNRTLQFEAANRELEAFAYSVSHDLRAPIRHISGFAELLQEQPTAWLDEERRHCLDAIVKEAVRMDQLIGDLLSFSRMGRTEFSAGSVDLAKLVQEVIHELGPEATGRAVRWDIGELPVVRGDRAMLRLVLVNLISNALKFTRPRPVAEIVVGCRQDGGGQDGGGQDVVSIRDNGIGFDMAETGRLFGVFERLPRSAAQFEGTGIGLANVRRIVQRHGGRTWAEGFVDRGATFSFSLPRG